MTFAVPGLCSQSYVLPLVLLTCTNEEMLLILSRPLELHQIYALKPLYRVERLVECPLRRF